MDLVDRHVVVTGGARGTGRALARQRLRAFVRETREPSGATP
jgi:NAD(P)-dependent dehydrogenase (short-subunit alcohol dehydrogenase family)